MHRTLPTAAAKLQPSSLTRRSFAARLAGAAAYPFLPAFFHSPVHAQQSSGPATAIISVAPRAIAYLMADQALRPASLETRVDETRGMVKRFWVQNWRDPQQSFEWMLNVAQAGRYEVTLMISAPAGTQVQVEGPSEKLTCETTAQGLHGFAWDRITLPAPLTLAAGRCMVRIRLLRPVTTAGPGVALKSIEVLNAAERPAMDARIAAFKSDTSWLNEAKFGFMCQCGEWAFPLHGPRKPWPAFADNFDVDKFADMVHSAGAGYAVWSATWATYYFPAPNKAIDAIMPGRTSKRDLIGEIADALAKRNIRLILYYHLGHDTNAANGDWWTKNWVSPSDKTLFEKNWIAIIAEVGQRYGERLAGWMFDDELVYYPVPYEQFGAAAKAGSHTRIISYNPWIQARGTDFQDFQFGEGFTGSSDLSRGGQGVWPSGPQKGLHAHGNFPLDGPDWGINKPDTLIESPHFTSDKAIQIALDAASRNIALSWNLLMYDDGSVSGASLELLQRVGQAVRKQYPRAKT